MENDYYNLYISGETSKINFDDKELELMADRFKMLAEGSRLRIIRSLFSGEKSVTGIVEATGLLQANVSKQLRLLQNHGIVDCRPEGLLRYYRLVDFTIKRICGAVCSIDSKEKH